MATAAAPDSSVRLEPRSSAMTSVNWLTHPAEARRVGLRRNRPQKSYQSNQNALVSIVTFVPFVLAQSLYSSSFLNAAGGVVQ